MGSSRRDSALIRKSRKICSVPLSLMDLLKTKQNPKQFYKCKFYGPSYPYSGINMFSLAGSDTTATAMRAIMSYLVMSPRIVAKLRDEIASHPISSPITDAEARKMPYLQAVIKEGLRIFPPVCGLMSKEVPPGGDTIDGVFIPEGTKIGYGMYGIFHNKKMWGDDPAVYRPERWFDKDEEKLREMDSTLELVFGYGKWKCLGSNVALMELNKLFVEVCLGRTHCFRRNLLTVK